MTLPGVLAIGPMKSGTTWIHFYLEARGDICLPCGVKETFFFDRQFARGQQWYGDHFAHCDRTLHRQTAEIAPSLFAAPKAPERVAATLGDRPVLIVTRRDPIKRAWSHYLHLRRYGYTREELPVAITRFPQIIEASRYSAQIARWRAALPHAHIVTLDIAVLERDPSGYARALCQAMGIKYADPQALALERINEAAEAPSFVLASLGRRAAYFLRDQKLYGVVNLMKRLRLKRWFFGDASTGARPPSPSAADLALLRAQLEDEVVQDA